jgi:hypothetical protein
MVWRGTLDFLLRWQRVRQANGEATPVTVPLIVGRWRFAAAFAVRGV